MSETAPSSDAFPRLDDEELAALARFAEARRLGDGETLFSAGDRQPRFYVLSSGRVRVVDDSTGERRTVRIHEAREFTGDTELLTGHPAVVTAVADGPCDVYEISPARLMELLKVVPALGDRILAAFLARRELLDRSGSAGLRVYGSRYARDAFRVREFLAKNKVPFQWTDVERDRGAETLLGHLRVAAADLPLVLGDQGLVLRNPSNRQLGERLGIATPVEQAVYDLAIVGAGPAGLGAAVYAASEGIKTIVLERLAPGGQAGCSSRIENYLGFPAGISGTDLAERAVLQATKFGAQLTTPAQAVAMEFAGDLQVLRTVDGERVLSRCVLIATGASYRTLDVEGCRRLTGSGVYHSATANEAAVCCGADAVVVGGGNSAGQAAMFLAEQARKVWLLVRDDKLDEGMSRYLVERIGQAENIEVLTESEVASLCGEECVQSVRVRNRRTGEERELATAGVFLLVGAEPHTDWLPPEIRKDGQGFLLTGAEAAASGDWPLRRRPFLLETSRPGVFAAGDVRAGSVKRVASAVGEGAMTVQFVHQVLAE